MPKSLDDAPNIPEDWVDDVYGAGKGEQCALDIWKRQHNLKVLEQRKAYREFFGRDFEEYPDWQTAENA